MDEFIDTTVNEALKPLGIMTGTPTGAVKIMIDPFFSANIKGQYSVQYDNVWNAIKHEHQKNFNAAVDRLFEVNARERKMATAENARLDAKGLPTSKIPSKMNGARIKSSFTGRAGDDSELEQRGKDMLAAYWESKGRK